jgi:hypothetical protein
MSDLTRSTLGTYEWHAELPGDGSYCHLDACWRNPDATASELRQSIPGYILDDVVGFVLYEYQTVGQGVERVEVRRMPPAGDDTLFVRVSRID